MNKSNILIFSIFLFIFIASCASKMTADIDKRQGQEYYELCLGANEYLVSHEILKGSDYSESARYFTDLIGHRFIHIQVTILNKEMLVDTTYTIFSNNGHKVTFKPLMTNDISAFISDKKTVVTQASVGVSLLDKNPVSNIILIQNASMLKKANKVIVTAAYFKVPVSDWQDIFTKLEPKYCDTSSISFVNGLQNKNNIFNEKVKQIILGGFAN
jgi:hypothetical protein